MENTKKNTPIRPFALEYADAKNEIFEAVNNASQKHGIPFFLLEDVVTELLHQVKANANRERTSAETAYKRQLEEQEKREEKEGD